MLLLLSWLPRKCRSLCRHWFYKFANKRNRCSLHFRYLTTLPINLCANSSLKTYYFGVSTISLHIDLVFRKLRNSSSSRVYVVSNDKNTALLSWDSLFGLGGCCRLEAVLRYIDTKTTKHFNLEKTRLWILNQTDRIPVRLNRFLVRRTGIQLLPASKLLKHGLFWLWA